MEKSSIKVVDGEGLAIADLNGDDLADIVINQFWLENSGVPDISDWIQHRYTDAWDWLNAIIAIGDIDSNGRADIVASPSELAGQRYRISWFGSPADSSGIWPEKVIEDDIEAAHHSLHAVDINLDGYVDVATAEMHQRRDPDDVSVYLNKGRGKGWTKNILGHQGSHGMRVGDLDNDGDLDLVGANWSGDDHSIYLWRNLTCSETHAQWKRHVVDPDQRWTSLFVTSENLDGDFLQGVAEAESSGSRYLILSWHRQDTELFKLDFSDGITQTRTSSLLDAKITQNEAISLADFNNDGTLDIVLGTLWLASTNKGYETRSIEKTNLPPDRNVVADIDHDGLPDIVFGFESIDKIGPIKWFRNLGRDDQPGTATTVADIVGTMSLDAGDVDLDGDIDILFIGWSHRKVLLYENQINQCNSN